MDGYIFKDVDNSEYGVLATNLWQKHFKTYELHEITSQRESKLFAEILKRLREGNHTQDDIFKIKERLIQQNILTYPSNAPHLFIKSAKVNDFNEKVHNASTNIKYNIKAQDSLVGANSSELRKKILNQIPNNPCKTKQLISNLRPIEGKKEKE